MNIKRISAFLFVGLFLFSALALEARSKNSNTDNTLSAERLWEMKRIGNPTISPDGRWVVAPVTHYTVEDDKSHTNLWLFATDGSVERPLTQHGSAAGQPVFSPDGSKLAFVTRREGDEAGQIYILPITQPGEAQRLTEVPTGVSAPRWVGQHIYFISNIFPGQNWDEMAKTLADRRRSHMSAHTWNALPFSSWDRWLDESREAYIFRIPANGGDIQPVSKQSGLQLPRSGQSTAHYDVAPDESLIAFVSDTNSDDLNPKLDIYLVAPGATDARNITPDNDAPDTNPMFSPNGRLLAFATQRIKGFYGDNRRLSIYDVRRDRAEVVSEAWDRSADGLIWAPNNRGLYGTIDDAGTRRVYFIGTDGTPRQITNETDYTAISISENGTLVGLNNSFLYPPRLHVINTRNGNARRIDSINDDILSQVTLGTYESVTYQGYGGQDIQMWVHYPPNFDPSKKYPLILLIHGGPHNAITNGFHFRWNAQTFTSWGYVVAWHNFHGSSGFGNDFTDSINPDWMTRPVVDTQKAAAWFAEKDWIDPTRMAAAGASYGGYLSSVLLAKEHPFNTLVIHAPVYNMYSQMAADFAVHSVRFGNYWDEGNTIYKDISPHYLAGDFRTPALIIHGQLDYRVPVGQAFELFRTLQSRGIESRLIYYPDENHWILKPNNSLYWYAQVREWIEKFAPSGGR